MFWKRKRKKRKSSQDGFELDEEQLKTADGGLTIGGKKYHMVRVGNELKDRDVTIEIKV